VEGKVQFSFRFGLDNGVKEASQAWFLWWVNEKGRNQNYFGVGNDKFDNRLKLNRIWYG